MIDHRTNAERYSATCFLNSLFREWSGYRFLPSEGRIEIEIGDEGEALCLPLERFSPLGRHRYRYDYSIRDPRGAVRPVDFDEMVLRICDHFVKVHGAEPTLGSAFRERVSSSRDTIARSLARPSGKPLHTFIDFEQALRVGHAFHPTPKSRDEFSDADLERYSPELRGSFTLRWIAADPSVIVHRRARAFDSPDWTFTLAREELGGSSSLDEAVARGFVPIPMHPWQWNRLESNPVVREYLRSGSVLRLGESRSDWHPTSSLRTVYRTEASVMLKFSMSVKLTNSVRHLLTKEADRGLQLFDVLRTPRGEEFLARFPKFSVIGEPAYVALVDPSGEALQETIVVARENPYRSAKSCAGRAVLAALTEDADDGSNPIRAAIDHAAAATTSYSGAARRWFDAYFDHVVRPLVLAHADFGIVLGAHQQNVIVELDSDGFPAGAAFRDCQGTGYTEFGFADFAPLVPSITRENGNVVSAEMGTALFTYYLILNSTFNVISSIVREEIGEEEVITWLRERLAGVRADGVRDATVLDTLLEGDALLHKSNFLCAFRNLNENTTSDPLALYTSVENPIAKSRGLLHANH